MSRTKLLFYVSVALWAGLVLVVLVVPSVGAALWEWLAALPWLLKGPLFAVTLPWAAALWVTQTGLADWAQILVVAAIAFLQLWAFAPVAAERVMGEGLADTPPAVMRRGGEHLDLVPVATVPDEEV